MRHPPPRAGRVEQMANRSPTSLMLPSTAGRLRCNGILRTHLQSPGTDDAGPPGSEVDHPDHGVLDHSGHLDRNPIVPPRLSAMAHPHNDQRHQHDLTDGETEAGHHGQAGEGGKVEDAGQSEASSHHRCAAAPGPSR